MSTTASSSPLLSIVVPTRDRPAYAALVLESLQKQSFQDFEVIVSDNAVHRRFEPDPKLFDGVRFRYVRAPAPMWMTDHYEFAVGHARGRYVGVLGDKSLLVRHALAQVAAEIVKDSPSAVSWRTGFFQPSRGELVGPGVVKVKRANHPRVVKVTASDALDYLLATYLEPNFEADHQLETRGSIYHGVFSSDLIRAVKTRFGRVFRFYAPDLNAQCAAMQVAKSVTHIDRPLELIMEGPSNGRAVTLEVRKLLDTREDAARGASGIAPPLITGISASICHLLASDLIAISGRTLEPHHWIELHRKAAYDLFLISGWPDAGLKRSQWLALHRSLARFSPEHRQQVLKEKWNARRTRARVLLAEPIGRKFGSSTDTLKRLLGKADDLEKRRIDHPFAALTGDEV